MADKNLNLSNLDLSALDKLSPAEKELALSILKEYSESGKSQTFNNILLEDFEEPPTDILTFVDDPYYLGNAWHDSKGNSKLYPYWREELVKIFPDNLTTNFNNVILSGSRGRGKAQPLDSLVFTEFGYVKMGQLKIGDNVYGPDGHLHKILGIYPQGKKKIIEITFSDNNKVKCSDEHLWTVYNNIEKKWTTITAKDIYNELLKNNKLTFSVPKVNCLNFKENNHRLDPYILGNYLRDPINYKNDKLFYSELIKLNLQTINKFIPKEYLFDSYENRLRLLEGLIAPNKKTLYFKTKIKNLLEDVKLLVQSLGGIAIEESKKSIYKIVIKLPKTVKLNNIKNSTGNINRKITEIKYLENEEECQCIYIDSKDHLYLTDNLIPTHNTEIAILIAAYLLHRILCMKDPVAYFHLKSTEKLVFAFMNIKLQLAEEIGVSKFQNTIQCSPWFLEHGTLEGRKTKVWKPKKFNNQEAVDIKIGSQADDLIGLPVYFCLEGDTEILTDKGIFKIKNLVDKQIKVPTVSDDFNIVLSDVCSVKQTMESNVEYEIELEDNTIIKCTPNHKFRLVDGTYKEAQNLTEDDDILSFTPYGYIYKKNNMKIKSIKVNYLEKPKQYYDVINAEPYNNFFIKTNSTYICSHNCFFDEISFIKNRDVEEQKRKAIDMINTALGGMKTRFIYKGKNPTVLALASSKRSDKSFLEEHMKKKIISEKDNVYISDGSVWEVKPPGTYKDEKFKVALGNKFLQSVIIPEDEDEDVYIQKGYKILEVPVDFKANFIDDMDRALCDYAGISSSSITKYINGASVNEIVTSNIMNPFTREILEIGDGPDDDVQYYNFFDIRKIDPKLKHKPLFIHLDMSYTGDMTGIAGVFIKGKKHSLGELDQSKDLFYSLAFSVNIKAPKGRHISFEKNRNFIYWLKEQGFNIKGITSDTYQSYDTGEVLRSKGYPYSILSVDRVDSSHVCLPYQYFRSTIYEKRLEIYNDKMLISQIIDLERNMNTGKIDHPSGGAKDVCDATCGAIFNASKHAEQFAYDYGEQAENVLRLNSNDYLDDEVKQLTLDLEQELLNMGRNRLRIHPSDADKGTEDYNLYDDIIIL